MKTNFVNCTQNWKLPIKEAVNFLEVHMTMIIHKQQKSKERHTYKAKHHKFWNDEIKLDHFNEHQNAKLAYALGLDQCECIKFRAMTAARNKEFDACISAFLEYHIKIL